MGWDFYLVRGNSRSKIKKALPRTVHYAYGENGIFFECPISFNNSWYYRKGVKGGLGSLYGMKGREAIKIIDVAIKKLLPMVAKERKRGKVLSQSWGKGEAYNEGKALADICFGISAITAIFNLRRLRDACAVAPHFTISPYED